MTSVRPPLTVAYFSMEMMLETDIPTYAGGLGVLAGDLLRSCADLSVPAVGITLVYSGNTFSQTIHPDGTQSFTETDWQKMDQLIKLPDQITLTIAGTPVKVGCWRYDIVGISGFVVPVYLLDTDFPENPPWVQNITRNLYGGGGDIRLGQEIVLGFGGVAMLRELGYKDISTYHLNEGHCAFVPLALMPEHAYRDAEVRQLCVFTTHTPVPEGHDKFAYDLAYRMCGSLLPWHIKKLATEPSLSMTHLALNLSRVAFAVSQKHQAVSEHLFPGYKFSHITNGVHHRSWTWPHLQNLYTQFFPGWDNDPSLLKFAPKVITDDALWSAHMAAKKDLISYVNSHFKNPAPDLMFDNDTLTVSLARRPVAYKRPLLLYHDLERFIRIGVGNLQIIQCGKSHPDDNVSQDFVKQIVSISQKLRGILKITYLENYSPKIARLLVAGSDLWLNTPRRPLEASGTSGMKAALNGVLNLSVLDGWWLEGFALAPQAGFPIGPSDPSPTAGSNDDVDADDLYNQLQNHIIPLYYQHRSYWIARMKQAIALGGHFNTHRAVQEYLKLAWQPNLS